MFNFLLPLFCEDSGRISLGRMWTMILLCCSMYFWFFVGDIPATMFQVLMLLLVYVTGTKAVSSSKEVATDWVNYKIKKTSLESKECKESKQAASSEDVDDILGGK